MHDDIEESRKMYSWVGSVYETLEASKDDLVPFEKYAAAAEGLAKPSSVARTLFAGATSIERVDKLVQMITQQYGMRSEALNRIVELVDKQTPWPKRQEAAD